MHALTSRTISLAVFACVLAFEATLALSASAIGIPGIFLVHLDAETKQAGAVAQRAGGETVMAKGPLRTEPEVAVVAPTETTPAPEAAAPAAQLDVDTLDPTSLVASQAVKNSAEGSQRQLPMRAFIGGTASPETLPWDAVEPIPYHQEASLQSKTPQRQPSRFGPPEPEKGFATPSVDVSEWAAGEWVKAKATQIKGANRARPMLHFELWVEPPPEVKQRIIAIAYDVPTGAARPRAQESRERQTGFRVGFGGLGCSDKITLTLTFDDGRSQELDVDGCKLLG